MNKNRIYENLIDFIGNTPLLRINFESNAKIYAKLEHLNPGGSIKDRTSLYMIEQAEKENILKPGGTIIEASSGNQGIAAAMIGNIKGYKIIITASEKISVEKKMTMEAYGAKVILCKSSTDFLHPEGYVMTARKIHENTPNSFFMSQYFNQYNADSHYHGIGKEIWNQIGNKITHCIVAMGTCGTIQGISRYLKEKNRNIKIIGVDAAAAFLATKGNPRPYQLDGMGIDYDSPLLKKSIIDEIVYVEDDDSHKMLKFLARSHGLLLGPASGAAAFATNEYSKKLSSSDTIVTIFTDSGRAYLSKEFYFDKK
jgi:cystathionine beta-synthase